MKVNCIRIQGLILFTLSSQANKYRTQFFFIIGASVALISLMVFTNVFALSHIDRHLLKIINFKLQFYTDKFIRRRR